MLRAKWEKLSNEDLRVIYDEEICLSVNSEN